jgi:hypothetical protein
MSCLLFFETLGPVHLLCHQTTQSSSITITSIDPDDAPALESEIDGGDEGMRIGTPAAEAATVVGERWTGESSALRACKIDKVPHQKMG